MKVQIRELRAAAVIVLDRLEETSGGEIELRADYYWDIPVSLQYDAYSTPRDFTMGQLSDDVEHVSGLASGAESPVPYHLVWIASVLRYVGAFATTVEKAESGTE